MGRIGEMLASTGGRILGGAIFVCALGLGTYGVVSYFKGDMPDTAYYTTFVCTETGKSFRHKNQAGEELPILSPYSGKNTGMPGEACYWTADGNIKSDPTWVLLNEEIGKSGPTFCPDCGRLVVGHNPAAKPGSKPPPTESEYAARPARKAKDGFFDSRQ